uniref:Uncharacterized protein n=1 Tax=Mycena chlorophos TaxID=658473 RepID=A0ABQ0KXK2_MYCCL|nr:predicted protein [Mycena chlorophos]
MSLPSLVGGFAIRKYDLAPSIIFAVGYAGVVALLIYRACIARSRTAVVFEAIPFALERVAVFCLRAAASTIPGFEQVGLSEYFQFTLAIEFLALANITSKLIRAVFVNTTNPPPEDEPESEPNNDSTKTLTNPPFIYDVSPGWAASSTPEDDDVKRRKRYRTVAGLQVLLLYLPAFALAIVATDIYPEANHVAKNLAIQRLRYASTIIGTILVAWELVDLFVSRLRVPRVDTRAVHYLLAIVSLLLFPSIYRLCALRQTTPDVTALTHAAHNTASDKAAFYIIHVLPEWLVVVLLSVFNAREICNLGLKGDFRLKDETPEKREMRWAKVRARKEKKEQKKLEKAAKRKGLADPGIELSMSRKLESV